MKGSAGSTDTIISDNPEEMKLSAWFSGSDPQKTIYSKLKPYLSLGLKLLVTCLIWAHFIWATVYFITKTDDILESTTCTGYGFWMILFIFINFGIAYSLVLRKYCIPLIRDFVWSPAANLLKKTPYGSWIFFIGVFVAILAYLIVDNHKEPERLMPVCGLVLYMIIGFAMSSNKRKIPWQTVFWGLILQFVLGLLMIRWPTGRNIFDCVGNKTATFLGYAVNGSAFVYGDLIVNKEQVFAFNSLSTIFFLAFMINILYYYGIMQAIVLSLGRFLQWIMGTSICESVNSAANIFLGQTEAPLLLKPYLSHLTDSEIHSVMTSGFATVSGTVLAAYINFGASPAHLITSSVMSAPAALCFSKLVYPETKEIYATQDNIKMIEVEYESVLDAASKGVADAAQMVIGIISSVIAFVAFIYFLNGVLTWLGILVGFTDEAEFWTVDLILGKVFIPITYTMGVPWDECEKVGQLIGLKTMVNEFVAFQKMGEMMLSERSKIIATYSICGFANPGSIGIQLSALGILMPSRKEAITRLVFRAFVGGCIVCFMTACIAALLIPQDTI